MSLKKAKEFMEKNFEKFTPIKVEDKDLLEEVNKINSEKAGVRATIRDITILNGDLTTRNKEWWNKIIEKYKIPENYRHKLQYDYDKKEIQLR